MGAPAPMIASLYDPDARSSTKRETAWVGYQVHVTEACDPERPRVITHGETTPATTPEGWPWCTRNWLRATYYRPST